MSTKYKTNTKFNISSGPIIELLSKKILIPIYQRSYTWTSEHVDALIDDVIERSKDGAEHYFGVIAVTSRKISDGMDMHVINKVIDGQQRLTTSLILLTYLVHNTKTVDADLHTFINNSEVFFRHEMESTTLESNIKNLLAKRPNNLKGKFKDNYDRIDLRLNNFSNDFLEKLLKAFSTKFIIAKLDYTIEDNEEMLVFENLNSKGSPLKPFDLIRNYVISMNDKKTPKENLKTFTKQIWNLTTSSKYTGFAKTDDKREKRLERFFEMYMICKTGKELKKYSNYGIYKNFKNIFPATEEDEDFELFIGEMRKYAILFLNLETVTGVGNNIWIRSLSNKDNHYALIFKLFEMFGEFGKANEEWIINDKVIQYIKVAASHVIKLMSVEGTGQSLGKMFSSIAAEISNGVKPKDLSKLLATGEISGTGETPTDNEFTLSLLQKPKQMWIPYALIDILNEIAYEKNPANEKINYSPRTVEHILPQKAKESEWPIIIGNKEDFTKHVNQIGNLVLLNGGLNSKLGNKGFSKKQEFYMRSSSSLILGIDLGLKSVKSYPDWTFKIIQERTNKLAKILLKYMKTV